MRPDRVVTRAHVVVTREDMSKRDMEIALAERLKGYEIDSLEVETVGETYPEEEPNGKRET